MYFTYLHRTADTGQIFYVGKGIRDRARVSTGRSEYWNRIAKKHGFKPEILAYWSDEGDAFAHEKLIIDCLKDMGHALCNLTTGGEGASGFKQSEETKQLRNLKLRGRKNSPETIARMRVAQSGKTIGSEQRKKLSLHWMGKKVGALNPTSRKCKCVETGAVFDTLTDAGVWLQSIGHTKASFKNISSVLSGEKKTAYGYRWIKA